MAAAKQMLDQVDESAASLMESVAEVQMTMAQLHSSVGVLINSMSEILKSMSEMKAALEHTTTTTTESRVTVEQQDLPPSPEKQPISADNSTEEKKKESRYTYLKRIKAEMPVFEGVDVNLWILKAERYFDFGDFTEAEKLRLVYICVDGRALNWFLVSDRFRPFVDWEDFKSRLLERFGDLESATRRLLALKQVGSVVDYLGQFEELSSQLPADSLHVFSENVFVNGLKEEIKDMVPLFQPKGLNQIILLARRLENSHFFGRLLMNPPPPPLDDAHHHQTE